MVSFHIIDVKGFMSKLLTGDCFHYFLLREATITTNVVFTIDGTLKKEFYDTSVQEQFQKSKRGYAYWKEVQGHCFSIIKGYRTPLYFKFVFQMPPNWIKEFLEAQDSSVAVEDLYGLYLNVQFQKDTLLCTTGTALKIFSLDKQVEQAWDEYVLSLFKNLKIAYECS